MKTNNITLQDIEKLLDAVVEVVDPLVSYEEACQITGKSLPALYSKISRSNIRPVLNRRMLRYSDVMKIKNKEV